MGPTKIARQLIEDKIPTPTAYFKEHGMPYNTKKAINTKSGKTSIFSGVLECADCGAKLYFCTSKKFEDRQDHFVCSNYKGNTGSCSAHFIRKEVLQKVVLGQIQLMLDYLYAFEDDFVKTLMDKSSKDFMRIT